MQHRLPRSWRAIAQMRQLPRRLAFLPQASWPVYALQSLIWALGLSLWCVVFWGTPQLPRMGDKGVP